MTDQYRPPSFEELMNSFQTELTSSEEPAAAFPAPAAGGSHSCPPQNFPVSQNLLLSQDPLASQNLPLCQEPSANQNVPLCQDPPVSQYVPPHQVPPANQYFPVNMGTPVPATMHAAIPGGSGEAPLQTAVTPLPGPYAEDASASEPEKKGTRLHRLFQGSDKPPTPARKVIKFITNLCFWAVCILLVAGSLLFAVSNDPQKSWMGYRTYNVLTESMTPQQDGTSPPGGFKKGAVILVRLCKPEEVGVGDIITFNPTAGDEQNAMFLTHRVKEIKDELGGKKGTFFVTRGDFNNADDPPISGEMLIGKKVFHIPGAGGFLQKVRENFLLSIFTIICLFACIFLFRWYFAAPKQARTQEGPDAGTLPASQY